MHYLSLSAEPVEATRAVEASNRESADRGCAIVEGLAPLVPIQTGLAANGSAIGRVELDVRALVSRGGGRMIGFRWLSELLTVAPPP